MKTQKQRFQHFLNIFEPNPKEPRVKTPHAVPSEPPINFWNKQHHRLACLAKNTNQIETMKRNYFGFESLRKTNRLFPLRPYDQWILTISRCASLETPTPSLWSLPHCVSTLGISAELKRRRAWRVGRSPVFVKDAFLSFEVLQVVGFACFHGIFIFFWGFFPPLYIHAACWVVSWLAKCFLGTICLVLRWYMRTAHGTYSLQWSLDVPGEFVRDWLNIANGEELGLGTWGKQIGKEHLDDTPTVPILQLPEHQQKNNNATNHQKNATWQHLQFPYTKIPPKHLKRAQKHLKSAQNHPQSAQNQSQKHPQTSKPTTPTQKKIPGFCEAPARQTWISRRPQKIPLVFGACELWWFLRVVWSFLVRFIFFGFGCWCFLCHHGLLCVFGFYFCIIRDNMSWHICCEGNKTCERRF